MNEEQERIEQALRYAWQRLVDAIREQRQADAEKLAAEAKRLRDEKLDKND